MRVARLMLGEILDARSLVVDVNREAREGFGWTMLTLRQYMSLTIFPVTTTLLFTEREMVLCSPKLETPALSSCMPLIRLVRAAGMWSTFCRRMESLLW